MDNRSQILMLCAGVFIGAGIVIGIHSIAIFDSAAALLADESASAVVRNYGLLAFGLVGVAAAVIRLGYTDTQQRQEKRSDLFDRFQKSSEMLDSENMAVRQAGLYTLAEIAKEQPAEFYIIVQSLFCGFLRHASSQQKALHRDWESTLKSFVARTPAWPPIRADMEDAIRLFNDLRNGVLSSKKIEKSAKFRPQLKGLFIPGYTTVEDMDFSYCSLEDGVFCDTVFWGADFSHSDIHGMNMDRANLIGCKILECNFGTVSFRWSSFIGTICTGFAADRVNLSGAVAEDSGLYLSSKVNKITSPSFLEELKPEFDNPEDQRLAQTAAIKEEELAMKEPAPSE